MPDLQRTAGIASLLNAIISVANAMVVLVILGAETASDPNLMVEPVRAHPFPIVVLELLKILSAFFALLVVFAMHQRLEKNSQRIARVATLAGIASACLLLAAGTFGLIAIALANRAEGGGQLLARQAYLTYSAIISKLGLAAVFVNGIWYIFISFTGIYKGLLPRRLAYVGMPLGVTSLIAILLPPIALLVLVLGLMWSIWLGVFLLRAGSPEKMIQMHPLEVFK